MIVADLGCGKNKLDGALGVDRVGPPLTQADITLNLGFESFPWPNCYVDTVHARFILEHIPFVVWDIKGNRVMPMVFLFNEVYRVLKRHGEFIVQVPNLGPMGSPVPMPPVAWAGIEHVSFWTWETPKMFSGDYYGYKEIYGHTSNFALVSQEKKGDEYMKFILRAE